MLVGFLVLTLSGVVFSRGIPESIKNHEAFKTLYLEDCGRSITDRIIGGKNAALGQYPWIASIGYWSGEEADFPGFPDTYECGGTIISELYILTAAHCSPEFANKNWVQVRVGEYDTRSEVDCVEKVCATPHQDLGIDSYYCHSGFNRKTFLHDICLMKLDRPIKFNNFVQPICLPFHSFFSKTTPKGLMEVAGWGINDTATGSTSNVLQVLKIPIIELEKCVKVYEPFKKKIIGGQICGGGVKGEDSCRGDSGGPLMAPYSINGPPRYFLVGVVSYGGDDCTGIPPAVYTFLPKYINWILSTISSLQKE